MWLGCTNSSQTACAAIMAATGARHQTCQVVKYNTSKNRQKSRPAIIYQQRVPPPDILPSNSQRTLIRLKKNPSLGTTNMKHRKAPPQREAGGKIAHHSFLHRILPAGFLQGHFGARRRTEHPATRTFTPWAPPDISRIQFNMMKTTTLLSLRGGRCA